MTDVGTARLGRKGRWILALVGIGIAAIFAVANGHLIYVSLASQPACVPHLKAPVEGGTAYRAAKSAC